MPKTTKTPHVHKFKRLKYKSGNVIFFCTQPDCTTKIAPALALGKRSICWRCGNEFLMNDYSIRLAKPHCEACHQSKSKVEVEGVSTVDMLTGEESIRTLTLEPETSRVEFSEPLEEKTLGQAMTEDWQINHPLRREEDFKPTESGALGKAEVNDLRSRLNLKPDEEDI